MTPALVCESPREAREAGRSAAGRQVAVFDLDRTLLPGSSLVHLGRALVQDGHLASSAMVIHLLREAVFSRRGSTDGLACQVRRSVLGAVAGWHQEDLVPAAQVAGAEIAKRAYPGARWLVEQHLEHGDLCVVLSASPQELVAVVAAEVGAHMGIGTRAETVDGRYTGRLDGAFCYGEGKLTRLAEELRLGAGQTVGTVPNSSLVHAYSDSVSDLPLLSAVVHPVATNPDRRLLALANQRGWPVIRFT